MPSTTSRALIPYGDTSFALRTELPSDYDQPSAAFVEVRDRAGDNLFTGTITAFADGGTGTVTVTSAAHGLATADKVTITGTTSYNGTFAITYVDAASFKITDTWVADDATGDWEVAFACTPKAISTLGSAAAAGAVTITLGATVTTAPTTDDLIHIAASAAGPAEVVRVLSYNTSTKVVTLSNYLQYAHSSAAVVTGRWLTDNINFSGADFTAGKEVIFLWTGFGTDDVPFQTTGEIMRASIGGTDLAQLFEQRYPHYWPIVEHRWDVYQRSAFTELRMMFLANGRDIEKLVEPYSIEELWMAQVAYSVAWARGDGDEAEREAMRLRRTELFDMFNKLPIWIDENQDGIEDDPDEVSPQDRPLPRRLLR